MSLLGRIENAAGKAARAAAKVLQTVWAKDKGDAVPDLIGLGLQAAEYASGLDLTGDGRVATINSVVTLAQSDGIRWGKRFEGEAGTRLVSLLEVDDDELRRWAAVAHYTELLIPYIERLVPSIPNIGFPIPTRFVFSAIEGALTIKTLPDILAELRKVGIPA